MKTKTIITALLFAFILASCAPEANVVPTETAIPTSTFTPVSPTFTPVLPTPSSTTIPPIETLSVTQKSVNQFASTMQTAGINITAEQILQQKLKIQTIIGADGRQYEIAMAYFDPDPNQQGEALEGNYPLVIKTEKGWEEATSKIVAEIKGIKLGILVGLYPGSPDFNKLQEIQSDYFNSGLVNVFWGNLQPTNKPIDFSKSGVDYNINFVQKNNMKESVGIALIWAADTPDWLRTGAFSKEQLTELMTNHIKEVVSRYKGKVGAWIVVNEVYFPPYRTDDVFYKTIGPDYIEIAFKTAREVDPSATLLYNDNQNETPGGLTTNLTHKIVDNLKSKGLIDAVGLQMHLDGANPPNKEDIVTTMKSYGLPIYITEFDVNMKNVGGSTQERFKKQAIIYGTVIEAALESGVCKNILVFQVGDKYSVWENFPGYGYSTMADPTPFDDNFNFKPAYYIIVKTLYEH